MIDLHTHSTASDGTFSPREVVLLAAEAGLTAVALTDHDTAAGNAEACDAGREAGIRVIPGIEMSAVWEGTEIHILGYFADPDDEQLYADLSWFRERRDERNDIILDNLAEDGILISREELTGGNPDTVITRAHFAKVLMDRGLVRDRKEAFESYLEYGGRYVPPKEGLTPEAVMELFRLHRIWPCLAHPVQYQLPDDAFGRLLDELIFLGLRGLEVWHPSHNFSSTAILQRIARLRRLVPTGGTDFHGASKPDIQIGTGFGNLKIRDDILDALEKDYLSIYPPE